MSARPFVAESDWPAVLTTRGIRPFPLDSYRRAAVVAAHPDDETLGVGGLLQRLHDQGTQVTLVIATDGEGAFPGRPVERRRELGVARRGELSDSLRAQGLGDIQVRWLGLPDSGLTGRAAELTQRLRELISDADLVLLPWPGDPHPDHQAAGEAALLAAPPTAHRFSYPIWLWHWVSPDHTGIPWSRAFSHCLTTTQRIRKSAAITTFASQLEPGPGGEEPILPPSVLAHFQRDCEILFREPPTVSAPATRFDDLYRSETDPWNVSTRWYERRKRAVALAALPRQRYRSAIEPACGTGVFTRELAARCDRLLAFDPVPAAVTQARAAVADQATVEVRVGALPGDLAARQADLIVFSEILYYLDDADLAATVEATTTALRTGGHLLAVHWLPWAPEAPRDGLGAHRSLLDHPALDQLVEHLDEEFVLHVARRR